VYRSILKTTKSADNIGMACLLEFGTGYIKQRTVPLRNAGLDQYQKVCVFLGGLPKQFDLAFKKKINTKKLL
jgi:hypothetical protein